MIGSLTGKILFLRHPQVLIQVAGVGYEVDLPLSDCSNITIGQEVTLYTHLVVREDAHLLFGFLTIASRDSFRTLIKVSGVGPKIGLALLSTLSIEELEFALTSGSVDTLCRTPGIGKKVAERMLLELKGKFVVHSASLIGSSDQSSKLLTSEPDIKSDITNALASLGYNDKEIMRAIKGLPEGINDLSDGIKEALKLLNKF